MFCSQWRVNNPINTPGANDCNSGIDHRIAQAIREYQTRSSVATLQHDNHRKATLRSPLVCDVSPGATRHLAGPLPAAAQHETANILECAAIALAAGVLTKRQVAEARLTNELLRQSQQTALLDTAGTLTRSFHRYLIEACPNTHMVALIQRQNANFSASSHATEMTAASIARAADDHDEILGMIECRASAKSIERFVWHHVAESAGCCAPN